MTAPAVDTRRRPPRQHAQPRSHWLVLMLALVPLLVALLLHGIVHHQVALGEGGGDPAPEQPFTDSKAAVGPVIDARSTPAKALDVRPGKVALTFDDGPDPVWTPRILEVLERHHVPATFFVVGSRATQWPELLRRAVAGGSEIGVHTFTHPDLAAVGDTRARLELSQTQSAIAGATGRQTSLLRLPYSSTVDSLGARSYAVIERAAKDGYLGVLSTQDPQDWSRPGVDVIVRDSMPDNGEGAIIVLHDSGGDRSQTVAALDQLIPRLKAAGYSFTTVSGAVGAPEQDVPAAAGAEFRGRMLQFAVAASDFTVTALTWILLVVGGLTLLRALLLIALAPRHVLSRRNHRWGDEVLEPVSVIVPAYNEAAGIAGTLRSLTASDYPALEIIVVDDGSTDSTADVVDSLELPAVQLIRQPNLGKSAALETGIAHARSDLLVLVDGDTVFEPGTIYELVQPFGDRQVGAVAGNAKVANRRGLIGRWQHIEYVISFNLDRRLYDLLGCMPTVPGAVGAYRREALNEAGGLRAHTLAEDTDLTMAVTRAGWRICYQDTARAWTEAPVTVGQLWRQRYRWCYGTMQAMWKHRGAVLSRGPAGRLGRRGLLYLALFQVTLPLLAPVVDVFALYGLLFLDPVAVAVAWLGFSGVQAVLAAFAFRLDRESIAPLWSMPLQQLVYRQLMYLVVIQSIVTALVGARLGWHKLERHGSARVGSVARSPAGVD